MDVALVQKLPLLSEVWPPDPLRVTDAVAICKTDVVGPGTKVVYWDSHEDPH